MKTLMYKRLVSALYFGNLIGITVYWWLAFGTYTRPTASNVFLAIGHISGLLAVIVILAELLMMARVRLIEKAYSLDQLTRIHRWNGYAAFGLMLAHIIFTTLGYQLVSADSFIGQIINFTQNYEDVFNALIGAILFFVVTVSSVRLARRLVRYEIWYFVHLSAYLGVILTFGHQVHTGPDFIADPGFRLYWYALYGLVAAVIAYYRFVVPLYNSWRLGLIIETIKPETHDTYTVQLGSLHAELFSYEPGQFGVWYVLDRSLWWQGHPFSMSSIPGEPLSFTVKASGDYTTQLQGIQTGTRVWVDGPHGKFVLKRAKSKQLLMIAGGVGITPIYALLKQLPSDITATVLYACRTPADIIFKQELEALSHQKAIKIEYYFSQQAGKQSTTIDSQALSSIDDLKSKDVYLCGPPAMMQAVTDTLIKLGVEKQRIYSERFDY